MIAVPAGVRIVVASRPVDCRNGLDGFAALVQQALCENPFVGDLFVFRAKRAKRVKIPAWDGMGLRLFHKRLEKGRFVWPPSTGRSDSPECGATGVVVGGTGLVAGAAKVSDCAVRVDGTILRLPDRAKYIGTCSSTLQSLGRIPSSSKRGSLP